MMMVRMITSKVPNPTHNPMISIRLLAFSESVPPVVSRIFFVSLVVRAVEVGMSTLGEVDELLRVENGVVVVRSGREVVDHGGVGGGDSVSVRVEVIVVDGVV